MCSAVVQQVPLICLWFNPELGLFFMQTFTLYFVQVGFSSGFLSPLRNMTMVGLATPIPLHVNTSINVHE